MAMFLHCKKAEIPDRETGASVAAEVGAGATGGLLVIVPRDLEYPLNTPMEIVFFDPILGMTDCRCTLSAPLIMDDHKRRSYRCTVIERLSQTQRREDIKVPLSAQVTVSLAGPGAPREAPATLCNISAGGVYILTQLQAKAGDRLSFRFTQTGAPLRLTAEVLRAEDRLDRYSRPIRGYGCRFVSLPPSHEAQLRSFVYREEKRLHKRDE